MAYSFDKQLNRGLVHSTKWSNSKLDEDLAPQDGYIAMSMADSEYEVPEFILNDIKDRLDHKILGYDDIDESVYEAVVDWLLQRHNWKIKKEWLIFCPGVLAGIGGAIEALSSIGDNIVVNTPSYPPFKKIITGNNRNFVANALKYVDHRYKFDYESFEKYIADSSLFLLCNPHNPTGRSWTREELNTIIEICDKYKVPVIADEIHSDIIYSGSTFVPFLDLSQTSREIGVSLISASKTFNIAGLKTAVLIVPNQEKRDKITERLRKNHTHKCNTLGVIATKSAFKKGEKWTDELVTYLEGNRDFAIDYIHSSLPGVKCVKPEATFLLWIDFSSSGYKNDHLMKIFVENAGVIPTSGSEFGREGEGFIRLNIACSRAQLEKALKRIKQAFRSI